MSDQQKYLAIKNWLKYQPDGRLRNKTAKLPWIKDYVDRENDYDYQSLTFFQRYVLDGLCRLAGSTPSRLIHNDITFISRRLHASRTDTPHIPHAVITLQARGFVIPTNDENFVVSSFAKAGGEGEGEQTGDRGGDRNGDDQVSKRGREGVKSVASLPPSAPEEDHSVPNTFSERLGRKLDSEEWFRADGLYRDSFETNPADHVDDHQIVALAEVCTDMQQRYHWMWDDSLDENSHPVRAFLAWNHKHKGAKLRIMSGLELAKVWFSDNPRSGRVQYENHDAAACPVCSKEKGA